MVRNLTTLILTGVLGSIVMAGNAEACLFKRCSCQKPAPCNVACVQPAPCVTPVATTCCAPKVRHCNFTLPKLFCHKESRDLRDTRLLRRGHSGHRYVSVGSALSLPLRLWSFAKRIRIAFVAVVCLGQQ